ncbi:MAG: alpha-amylase family glycosyl hydrolase [Bacteroidetes bacterium]|nr:alpha-amylase family glycosyl hydrolase [Bacteroidota bacterium]
MKELSFLLAGAILAFTGCKGPGTTGTGPGTHADWSRNATIYEVNIRQYTPQGTFKAFEQELPRLQKMGVDILWLMPINPLGVKNRKGTLGSYYSVSDYLAVNPEYGTKQDFVDVVKKAHELGMKVIVDWVANHTSWDNNLITKHPEWYRKDSTGKIVPPVADWTDVAGLDYSQPGLREYMTDALLYWIREADIDGYRCDVAGMLPVDFWHQAIPEIRKIKPVFMLAEDETPKMHDTGFFDATYSWQLFHAMNNVAQGKKPATVIDSLYAADLKKFPKDAYRMCFTSNHDENSWNGTEFERMGEGARTFAVLSFTMPGIPLIYSGQESAMNKRLRFFDKDTIPWGNYPLESFYEKLNDLKAKDKLLDAGDAGGEFIKVPTSNDQAVYAFLRKTPEHRMFVVLNLSAQPQTVILKGTGFPGNYEETFTGTKHNFNTGEKITLNAWAYQVYTN